MLDATAATAANRFGLGARPGELASIGAAGRDWLRAQLRAAPPVLAAPELRSSQQVLAQALELRRSVQAERKAVRDGDSALPPAQLQKVGQFLKPIYVS